MWTPTLVATRGIRARPLLAGLLAILLLATLLAGCADDDLGPESTPEQVQARQQAVLDLRDEAVLTGNREQFMSTVARGDRAFVRRQQAWFDNVSQLPWAQFQTTVGTSSWPQLLLDSAWGPDATVPRLTQASRLEGFDEAAVTRETGLAFGYRNGVLKVVGDRTRNGDWFPGYAPAPWDLTPLTVRQQAGVLGLFDATTVDDAGTVMNAVIDGISEVSRGLPFTWSQQVVVYAFGKRRVLRSFKDVPGGKIQHLGAMTFPVLADDDAGDVAGLRFAVLPSSIKAGQPFLGRIVRHELTHVALGDRDDAAPLWLSEGLAEYLGAREIPADQRRIAAVAVDRARAMGERKMPASDSFNGPDQDWHYALSWMACDYIAEEYGEARLWDLVDAFARGATAPPDERQDEVLSSVLGYGSAELAQRASDRIAAIYG